MNKVLFISLGPGDPELITLKGLKALQNADIILAPSTIGRTNEVISRSKEILAALDISAEKVELFHVPMSKERGYTLESYEAIALKASGYCAKGLNVAIVAEGDSGFYSSSQYLNDMLIKMDIPTKKIGGIPAFIACGALANIHVAKQDEQLIVIPGIVRQKELILYLDSKKSIVIMKPSQCEDIIKEFVSLRDNIEYHYFENVGITDKEFYTSDRTTIIDRKFPYFSLLIIQNKSSV